MNNKGQSLIIFILILPLIGLFIVFFTKLLLMNVENTKISRVIQDNMQIALNNDIRDISKIKKVIDSNNLNLKVLIEINNDNLIVKTIGNNKNKIENIIGMNAELRYCGNYKEKQVYKC